MASNAHATSSSLEVPVPTQVLRRPTTRHRRRASQPELPSSSRRPYAAGSSAGAASATSSPRLAEHEWSSSEISSVSGDSDSEDEDWKTKSYETFEYLDLSVSLPYTLASLRGHLLAQVADLEQRVRSLYAAPAIDVGSAKLVASFQSHVAAVREDIRRLTALLPRVPNGLALPSSAAEAFPSLAARGQSLAADWERLGASFPGLPSRPSLGLSLPRPPLAARRLASGESVGLMLPNLPSWADVPELGAVWGPLAAQLPSPGAGLLSAMSSSFEACQDAFAALTLRDCFFLAKTSAAAEASGQPSTPGVTVRATRQFDALLARLKATGEEVRAKGHARASSVAKRAREAEDVLYAAALELAGQGQKLIRYEHLPELWKNNAHILSGYRFIPSSDMPALLRSTFQIHNETGNIHSHLLGAVLILPLFWPSKGLDPDTTPMDRLVQTVYLIAALKCLVLSVSWHIMAGCANACWFERFACVDYTGIAWLVAASVWTLVYNGFYCQPNLALFYSLTTLLVGAVGATVPWAAWFNERQNKGLRIAVFLTMCFTGLAPFTHAAYEHGLAKTINFFAPIVPSLCCYVGGLVFYAFQFPESLAPGKFDIWGHAHQIWHISIVGAILLHYRAALVFHENRFAFSCAATAGPTFSRTAAALLEAAGGLQGIKGLQEADDAVLGWRRALGTLGGGLVGRTWDVIVAWAQTW